MEFLNKKSVCQAIIAVLSVAAYFYAFRAGFFFDDYDQVVGNRWITDFRYIPDIFASPVWEFLSSGAHKEVSNYYRPLMHLTYMAGYHLFGLNPLGFHIINLLVHAANGIIAFAVFSRLLPGAKRAAILSGALLFALTPVNVEAVTWIAAVPELSFVLFSLLSFYFFIRSCEGLNLWLIPSIIFYTLAVFSKETAVTYPALLLICLFPWKRPGKAALKMAPFVIVTLVFLYVRSRVIGAAIPTHEMGLYDHVLTAAYLTGEYMEKLVFPFSPRVYYPFLRIDGLGSVNFIGLAILAALTVLSIKPLLKRDFEAAGKRLLGLAWITAPILPAILMVKYIQGERIFAERYLYFSTLGLAFLFVLFLKDFEGRSRTAAIAITLSVLIPFSVKTVFRSKVWTDNTLYWSRASIDAPGSATVLANLGSAHVEKGRFTEAIDSYGKALEIKPGVFEILFNLAGAYNGAGQREAALRTYAEALELTPSASLQGKIHAAVGDIYRKAGLMPEAVESYERAAGLEGADDTVFNRLGIAYAASGDTARAEAAFRTALSMNPGNRSAERNIERLKAETGM